MDKSEFKRFENDIKDLIKVLDMPENEIVEEFLKAFKKLSDGAYITEYIPILVKAEIKDAFRHKMKSKFNKEKGTLKIKIDGEKFKLKAENKKEQKALKLFNKFLKLFKKKNVEEKKEE